VGTGVPLAAALEAAWLARECEFFCRQIPSSPASLLLHFPSSASIFLTPSLASSA
jgi:hypothetical protein